jgi:glutathione S-transferase
VADAYLFVMLRWATAFGVPMPLELLGSFARVAERETGRRALAEEGLPQLAPAISSAAVEVLS